MTVTFIGELTLATAVPAAAAAGLAGQNGITAALYVLGTSDAAAWTAMSKLFKVAP